MIIIFFQQVYLIMSRLIANKYQVIRVLGRGAFGKVLLTRYDGVQYAIKQILKAKLNKQDYLIPYLQGQIECMRNIKSQYVMNLIDVEQDNTAKYMICEYCNGGNLFQYQSKLPNRVIPMQKTFLIVSQIIKGIQHLHQKQYLHRDLKPQNILVKKEGEEEIFKLADFGFARKEEQTTGTILGTKRFMAPEIYKEEKYGYGVDIWALGVIIYYMLNNEYPFNPQEDQQMAQIQRKCTPYFSYKDNVQKTIRKLRQNCNSETEDFFRRIFQYQPKKRMTFHQIKEHQLLKQYFEAEANTPSYLSSSMLYKNQFHAKINMPYLNKLNKIEVTEVILQGIQEQPQQSSIRKTTKKYIAEIDEIEYYLHEQKFIYDMAASFKLQDKYLLKEIKLALRYNLLKLYLIESKKLYSLLKQKRLPESCQKNLQWDLFFKSNQFNELLKRFNQQIMLAESQFEQSYHNCQASKHLIKQFIPKFVQTLNYKITESNFNDFKYGFRSVTTYANKSLIEIQKKNQKNATSLTILRINILICHVLNKVFLKKELKENFEFYFLWKKNEKSLDEDPQKFYFDSFKRWLSKQNKIHLIKTVNIIWKRYFD